MAPTEGRVARPERRWGCQCTAQTSGSPAWKSSMLPLGQGVLMFHFLKSSWRLLQLLEARFFYPEIRQIPFGGRASPRPAGYRGAI